MYKNIKNIDPSDYITLDDLNDPWHYNNQGLNKMHKLIIIIIIIIINFL